MRNSVFIILTTIGTSLLDFGYWTIAARTYSASEVGLASALIGVATLISNLSNLGLSSAVIQILPRRAAGAEWSVTINAALVTGGILSLLTGLVMVIVLLLFSPQFGLLATDSLFALTFVIEVRTGRLQFYSMRHTRRNELTVIF